EAQAGQKYQSCDSDYPRKGVNVGACVAAREPGPPISRNQRQTVGDCAQRQAAPKRLRTALSPRQSPSEPQQTPPLNSAAEGQMRAQSPSGLPKPATRMTTGVPAPARRSSSLYPPTSTNRGDCPATSAENKTIKRTMGSCLENIGDTSSPGVGRTASASILQRADGINARRAPGRRKARGQRSDQQHRERGRERQWVAGADLVKQVAHQSRQD